jgi:threonine dehydratase
MTSPTPADVAAAAERIGGRARRTPVLHTELDSSPLVLKLELVQLTGSFKIRGALNALLGTSRPSRVVTASGGNHGLAVATAARLLDLPATIYVPEPTPAVKADAIAAAGAKLVRVGASYAEAAEAAKADTDDARYVPAYDDPLVIAGQGTLAAEVVADAPEVDTLVVAAGGGGLAAGTVLGSGGREVVVVEPEGCACVHEALLAGRPVDTRVASVASSALGATRIGALPFAVLSEANVRSVLVSDEEILAARDLLWSQFRLAVEPAAAAPLAAWLAGRVPGERPCLVVCGANAAWTPA